MEKEEFIEEIKKLNIKLSNNQLNQLEEYYSILIASNEKVNLTAITEEKEVYLKHFYDSLTLVKVINLEENLTVCDIGTGAGFPGLVLKIVFPNLKVTLVDALNKRVNFLNDVIKKLDLKDVIAIHSRIEDLKQIESFDVVVTRAVAKTNVILELGSQLVKKDGYFILMKGDIEEELNDSTDAIKKLSYQIDQVEKFLLPIENSKRTIIKLKKNKNTNKIYPRNFVKIKKNPL